jgi:hypothetical protein
MNTMRIAAPALVFTLASGLLAQQHVVAPAAYTTTDAMAYEWIAGASRPLRQQTLVGASHLAALQGHLIEAIELRRTAANEAYAPGTTQLTVTMSISTMPPVACSATYADNVGANPQLVFSGQVALPASPATTGSTVAWTPDNTVRIPLQVPFLYTGGTLVIDVVGQPVSGQNANWWMADAMFEHLPAQVVDLGGGCGIYGGVHKRWSHVAQRSLVPGGSARFFAYGPAFSLGLCAFGTKSSVPVPLSLLGLPAGPTCNLHLASIDGLELAVFEPEPHPGLLSRGAVAEVRFKIPAVPTVLGFTLTTQWLEWTQMATSNAIEWTVAGALPTLDMALVEGHPQAATGEPSVHLAHVVRFEYQ